MAACLLLTLTALTGAAAPAGQADGKHAQPANGAAASQAPAHSNAGGNGNGNGNGNGTGNANGQRLERAGTGQGAAAQGAADKPDHVTPQKPAPAAAAGSAGSPAGGPSDPDGMSNGGADRPGGTGGTIGAQDRNNGCGNDADREDDNRGHCGRPRPKAVVVPAAASVAKVVSPTRDEHVAPVAAAPAAVQAPGASADAQDQAPAKQAIAPAQAAPTRAAQQPVAAGAGAGFHEPAAESSLPFTGLASWLAGLIAVAFLAGGLLARRLPGRADAPTAPASE